MPCFDYQKYLQLQENMIQDPKYSTLLQEYHAKNHTFLTVLNELEPQQRQTIEDYLSICIELHTKMLLRACAQ